MSPVAKRKVLFVDDDEQWRDRVAASLGAAGFDVLTAADGSEAMIQGMDPSLSLMIVDEDLAGESGSMLSQYLRHNNPVVPTLLYAGTNGGAGGISDQASDGADGYLCKGSMEELIVNVGRFLR